MPSVKTLAYVPQRVTLQLSRFLCNAHVIILNFGRGPHLSLSGPYGELKAFRSLKDAYDEKLCVLCGFNEMKRLTAVHRAGLLGDDISQANIDITVERKSEKATVGHQDYAIHNV